MSSRQLTIGELARRTGVATSALRYWEELGLMPAPARVSGQRRYPSSAVQLVGIILVLREVGFSLRELKALIASRPPVDGWRQLAQRELAELDQRIAHAQAAASAGTSPRSESPVGTPSLSTAGVPSRQVTAVT